MPNTEAADRDFSERLFKAEGVVEPPSCLVFSPGALDTGAGKVKDFEQFDTRGQSIGNRTRQ